MIPSITLTNKEQEIENLVVVNSKLSGLPSGVFSASEKKYSALAGMSAGRA